MADSGDNHDSIWPMPKFLFSVDFGDDQKNISFQEVSGLDTETQVIEYRHGNSPQFSTIKMPGIAKVGNVTMKKGIFVNDGNFLKWYGQIRMNTIERVTITIRLLDEAGKATMTWTLANAWPVKIQATDLKSDGNEVAVEAIEVAYETLMVDNAGSPRQA
jgi:phage tail-like protein